jgi:cysteine rich repeat protein
VANALQIVKGQTMKFGSLLAHVLLIQLGFTLSSVANAQSDLMSSVLQQLNARIQQLQSSCSEDISKYCGTVTPGDGRLVYCMQAHDDKISPKCAYTLDDFTSVFQETMDKLKDTVQTCRGDIEKLCGKTQPGQGRIAACLVASKASISQTCSQAIEKLQIR